MECQQVQVEKVGKHPEKRWLHIQCQPMKIIFHFKTLTSRRATNSLCNWNRKFTFHTSIMSYLTTIFHAPIYNGLSIFKHASSITVMAVSILWWWHISNKCSSNPFPVSSSGAFVFSLVLQWKIFYNLFLATQVFAQDVARIFCNQKTQVQNLEILTAIQEFAVSSRSGLPLLLSSCWSPQEITIQLSSFHKSLLYQEFGIQIQCEHWSRVRF